jgi:hypothetical protein
MPPHATRWSTLTSTRWLVASPRKTSQPKGRLLCSRLRTGRAALAAVRPESSAGASAAAAIPHRTMHACARSVSRPPPPGGETHAPLPGPPLRAETSATSAERRWTRPSLSTLQDHGRACRPTRPMGPRPARAAVLHPRHSHANNVCFRLHPGRHMDGTFSAQARLAPPLVATLLVWPVHAAPRRATRMVYVSAAAHSRASRAGSQHGCHRRAALTHSDRAHSGRLLPTLPRLLDARVRLG